MSLIQIYYHTDYAADQLPANTQYMFTGAPVASSNYIELTSEGKIFEGWYSSPTFEEETKIVAEETMGSSTIANWYAKWSVVTVSSLLTNLADELRTLTNTTDKMGLSVMAGHVSDANTEVDEQDTMVEQIIAAMSGKAVGSESYTVTWTDYGLGAFLIYTKPDLTSGMFLQEEFVSQTVSFTVAKGSTVVALMGDSADYELTNAEIVEAGYNDYVGNHYFIKITGNATIKG